MKDYIRNIIAGFGEKERGGLLAETVVAVMVFTAVGTAVLTGLSTTQVSGSHTWRQSVAENIARNQMEYVASLPYQPPPYSYPLVSLPAGYAVTADATFDIPGDTNIQRITVTVSYEGDVVLVLETFRSNLTL
jgi:hypothetical protein